MTIFFRTKYFSSKNIVIEKKVDKISDFFSKKIEILKISFFKFIFRRFFSRKFFGLEKYFSRPKTILKNNLRKVNLKNENFEISKNCRIFFENPSTFFSMKNFSMKTFSKKYILFTYIDGKFPNDSKNRTYKNQRCISHELARKCLQNVYYIAFF